MVQMHFWLLWMWCVPGDIWEYALRVHLPYCSYSTLDMSSRMWCAGTCDTFKLVSCVLMPLLMHVLGCRWEGDIDIIDDPAFESTDAGASTTFNVPGPRAAMSGGPLPPDIEVSWVKEGVLHSHGQDIRRYDMHIGLYWGWY